MLLLSPDYWNHQIFRFGKAFDIQINDLGLYPKGRNDFKGFQINYDFGKE
jgi:hypothetical protein